MQQGLWTEEIAAELEKVVLHSCQTCPSCMFTKVCDDNVDKALQCTQWVSCKGGRQLSDPDEWYEAGMQHMKVCEALSRLCMALQGMARWQDKRNTYMPRAPCVPTTNQQRH